VKIETPGRSKAAVKTIALACLDLLKSDHAAQIVEFAVALPLLVVFVVGIFDFSSAYTLKQKLTNIARDAARTAAADPASDLGNNVPASIVDAYGVINNYLLANRMNSCGATLPTSPTSPLLWTISGTGCTSPDSLTITINRGYYFPAVQSGSQPAPISCMQTQSPGAATSVIATCVSIQYGYQWQFGRAASLFGSTMVLPPTITAIAVSTNEN